MKKILTIVTLFLVSCSNQENKIEPGDIVTKCVIDSTWRETPKSTLDFETRYFYYMTDCGDMIITYNSQVYKIGDTITYVKKVKK